jgi:predicted transcriptional regulator
MENTQGKTIRQIAEELGVSKQAVQKRIKREPLATKLSGLSATVAGTVYISVVGAELIKSDFAADNRQPVADNQPTTNRQPVVGWLSVNPDEVSGQVSALIDTLRGELASKEKQLEIKDKQIEELNTRLAETTSALVAVQQTAQAAQALHAGTIQAQLDDGKRESFFSRIFGGKRDATNS